MMRLLRLSVALLLCTFFVQSAFAQITGANFSATKIKDCGQLLTTFTAVPNDPNYTYHWDFGTPADGVETNFGTNTVGHLFLFDPNNICRTITLTITNSAGQTATVQKVGYICVYSKPIVDFAPAPGAVTVGCAPLCVQFIDQSLPGAGATNIVSWRWASGGGTPNTVGFPSSPAGFLPPGIPNPTFCYDVTGNYSVTLIVTDNNNCSETINKANSARVTPTPKVTLTSPNTSGCSVPFTANLNVNVNTYGAPGVTTQIIWGDSTAGVPNGPQVVAGTGSYSHTYTSPGAFTVFAVASGTNGCRDTTILSSPVSVGGATSFNFSPASGCVGTVVDFIAPNGATQILWDFGGGQSGSGATPSNTYLTPGTFYPTMTATLPGGCRVTKTSDIPIRISLPPPATFTLATKKYCSVPATPIISTFSPTPPLGSVSWDFGQGAITTNPPTPRTYTTVSPPLGNTITVSITDSIGCTASYSDTIYIDPIKANFTLSKSDGCLPYTTTFLGINTSTGGGGLNGYADFPITSTKWYQDGSNTPFLSTTAPTAPPPYTFATAAPCQHTFKMVIANAQGCKDSLTKTIKGSDKPTASFTFSPGTTCAQFPVTFNGTASTPGASGCTIDKYYWNFGRSETETGPNASPIHLYKDTALALPSGCSGFRPWLVVESGGCKSDTARNGCVIVTPAVAKFKVTPNCNNRLCVDLHVTDNPLRADNSIGSTFSWSVTRLAGTGAVPTIPSTALPQNPNQQVCFATPGRYLVVLTVGDPTSGCTQSASKTFTIANPVARMTTSPMTGCAPFRVNFSSTSTDTVNIQSYSWTFVSNTTPPIPSVVAPAGSGTSTNVGNVLFTTPGLYTNAIKLTITDVNGCVDSVRSANVDIRGTIVNFSAAPSQGCVPTTVNLTNTSTSFPAGSTISNVYWDLDNNGVPGSLYDATGNTTSFIANNPDIYRAKIVVVNSAGCRDSLVKITFTGYGPSSIFSTDTLRCTGQDLRFGNISFGQDALTYAWSFPGANTTSSTDRIPVNINYPTEGNYTVCLTVTQNNPITCTASSCKTVRIGDPRIDFAGDTLSSFCPPLLVTLTSTSANCVSYQWYIRDQAGVQLGASNLNPYQYLFTEPGLYTVVLVGTTASGCVDSLVRNDYISITGPQGTYSFTPSIGCAPLNVQFDITGIRGATTAYINAGALGSGCGSALHQAPITGLTATTSHNYICAGVYNPVLLLQDNNGCERTIDLGLLVTVDTSGGWTNVRTAPICRGESAQLHAAASDPNATYAWYTMPGHITPPLGMNPADVSSPNPVVSPLTTTTYYVDITTGVAPNVCVKTDTVRVEVKPFPLPVITFDRTNVVICQGTSVQITASGVVPADPAAGLPNPTPITNPSAYVWHSVPGTSMSDSIGITNPFLSPIVPTTYTVTVTGLGGCTASNSISVDVLVDHPELLGPNRTICRGGSVNLPVAPGYTRPQYSPAIGLSCTTCPNPIASPTSTQTYYLAVDNANNCRVFDSITVYVIPPDSISAGPDKFVCLGSSVQLDGRVLVNQNSAVTPVISWIPTPTSGDGTTTPTVTPAAPTVYTMTYTNDLCVATDVVQVDPRPSADVVTSDVTICAGDSTKLLATGAANFFTWTPATNISGASTNNPTVYPQQTTTYTVVASLGGNCATASATAVVNVNQLPSISISPRGGSYFKGKPVQVTLTTNGVSPTYVWTSLGNDSPQALSCYNCYNPVFRSDNDQPSYSYQVVVTDANGCSNKAPLNLRLRTQCEPDQIFVPNAFSPNGDGQNDVLYVRGSAINGITIFRVFDRWGNLMFETSDINKGWDGTYNGKQVTPDVYVYYVEAPCVVGGDSLFKKGNVTVTK